MPVLAADAPIPVRPTRATRHLAGQVVRVLALRLDVPIAVGEDAPPEILEAVPMAHVAIDQEDDHVRLVLAGPEGRSSRRRCSSKTSVGARSCGRWRSLEGSRDTALDGPPPGQATRRTVFRDGREVTWTYYEREGGLFGPLPRIEATAKPTVYLGFLAGCPRAADAAAGTAGSASGSAGAPGACCSRAICRSWRRDRRLRRATRVQYRPITLALRLLLRPFVIDETVSFAFGLGLLTRFGVASLVGVDASRLTTNFGLRGSVEGAWRVADPFEIVLDLGVDAHTSPAILTRLPRPPPGAPSGDCPPGMAERVLVEDIITVWGVLAIRVRP
ncbi:MAG: hypothetical protein R3B82_18640 [Sandaracinaceae bacterium]